MKFLHLSKELHMMPRFALGVDGKSDEAKPIGYDLVLKRGDGKTYVNRLPKEGPGRNARKRQARTGMSRKHWTQVA